MSTLVRSHWNCYGLIHCILQGDPTASKRFYHPPCRRRRERGVAEDVRMDSEVESDSGPDVVNTGVVRESVGQSHVATMDHASEEERKSCSTEMSSGGRP